MTHHSSDAAPRAVVVTGSNGGLGSAMVASFRDHGIRVVGIDRTPDRHDLDCFVRFDIGRLSRDEAAHDELCLQLEANLHDHELAGLVNNAAVQILGSLDELSLADFNESLGVNLTAPLMLTRMLRSRLVAAGGVVLNIGSIHSQLTKPGFVSYAISKAALSGLSQALSVDQGARLRVLTLLPAAVDTDMLRAGFADDPSGLDRLNACHPAGRIGAVDEVARLCRHLVLESYPFLHGASIDMTGGIINRLHDPA